MMVPKRVTVFKNGTKVGGKVFLLPSSLDDFKTQVCLKFDIQIIKIFNQQGGEVDDIELIRDNDLLFISSGEDFISSGDTRNPQTTLNVKTSDWITLNVGGKYFTTSRSTLTTKEPNSMLARMFAQSHGGYFFVPSNIDPNGAYLIDRSPTYFEPLLNYLRNGQVIYDKNVNPQGVLEEARFFGIESIVPLLEQIVQVQRVPRDDLPLSRRDVIDALIKSPLSSELRFQGVNLAGADLSKLDLRNVNFKFATLRGCKLMSCNLSWCCLERSDLAHACLDGAQLLGVKSLCANMEGAQLKNCNFEDPAGTKANMEGVNLKGANLEGSDMAGVNLRVATLKNANLQNCDLRGAVLAGADLENCDLSGSDLHEANLRGANLKDAAFELMLTPLHMSQTIR